MAAAIDLQLSRVTGLVAAVDPSAGLIGPALAAALITVAGPPATVAVTAGCFAISAVLVASCLPAAIAGARQQNPAESYLTQLRDGWRFLVGDRLLLGLALMITVTNLLDVAKTAVLLPLWAQRDGYGIAAVGLVLTCMAGASVLSSLAASWLGDRLPRRTTYFVAFLIAGPPPFLVLGLDPGLGLAVITYVIAGLASGLINPVLGAIIFERIPEPMLGRVTAPLDALAWAGMPVGGLVAAALVAGFGLGPAFVVCAGLYAAAVLAPALGNRSSFDPPPLLAETAEPLPPVDAGLSRASASSYAGSGYDT